MHCGNGAPVAEPAIRSPGQEPAQGLAEEPAGEPPLRRAG
jgi:hypothetical protein